MKLTCIPAPNRYRKMNPSTDQNNHQFWFDKFQKYQTIDIDSLRPYLNQEIIERQKEEFSDKGYPLGMGYSFDICDEVLIWSDEPVQTWFGMRRTGLFVFNNSIGDFN